MASPALIERLGSPDARNARRLSLARRTRRALDRVVRSAPGGQAPKRYVANFDDSENLHRAAAEGMGIVLGPHDAGAAVDRCRPPGGAVRRKASRPSTRITSSIRRVRSTTAAWRCFASGCWKKRTPTRPRRPGPNVQAGAANDAGQAARPALARQRSQDKHSQVRRAQATVTAVRGGCRQLRLGWRPRPRARCLPPSPGDCRMKRLLLVALVPVMLAACVSAPSQRRSQHRSRRPACPRPPWLGRPPASRLRYRVHGATRRTSRATRTGIRRETLAFFGVEARASRVEIWPGGGWYAEVLAPALNAPPSTTSPSCRLRTTGSPARRSK